MVWTAIILSLTGFVPVLQIFGIAVLVFYIILLSGFIQHYSAGLGFWLAYIFLPIVAVFLVDKVDYIGEGVATAGAASSAPAAQKAKAASKNDTSEE